MIRSSVVSLINFRRLSLIHINIHMSVTPHSIQDLVSHMARQIVRGLYGANYVVYWPMRLESSAKRDCVNSENHKLRNGTPNNKAGLRQKLYLVCKDWTWPIIAIHNTTQLSTALRLLLTHWGNVVFQLCNCQWAGWNSLYFGPEICVDQTFPDIENNHKYSYSMINYSIRLMDVKPCWYDNLFIYSLYIHN